MRPGAEADRIEVRGLRVIGVHGVLPEERRRPQPFELDLDLELAERRAVASDELADTADYAAAVAAAVSVVTGPPHNLLESLAGAVAHAVLADTAISSATVTVRKLRPPVPHQITSVGMRVTRRQS